MRIRDAQKPVFGIRDILVRIWIPGSVGYLKIMDPDPTPDPTPSSLILMILKKSYFFLKTWPCPQAHHHQSEKFNFLIEFCVKILFCRHYFSQLNTFMRKGKDPDPHL
jgi:hypothetical protein